MIPLIRNFLGIPGIHYLVTRFGGPRLRAASFDQKFNRGDWDFNLDRSAELVSVVEQYAHKGHILMLGCGSASIVSALAPECFAEFVGVDISPEAISRASRRATPRIRFTIGDCTTYACERAYDLILFSESLYYISPFHRKALLKRLASHLAPTGSIVVTIADPKRYSGIVCMIRKNFSVIEDRPFQSGDRHLIVFR